MVLVNKGGFEVTIQKSPFVVEPFQTTPSLGILACFEGNCTVMLGKVTKITVDRANLETLNYKAK